MLMEMKMDREMIEGDGREEVENGGVLFVANVVDSI